MATFTLPTNFSALGINASGHVSRVTLADTLTTYTSNTPQTGDAYARLGAPAGASVSADVAAVNAKTTNLPASFPSNFSLMLIDADGRAIVDAHKVHWSISGSTQTVYRADNTTSSYTKSLTTSASADPITGN
jgi:hypothetical protein